MKCTPNLVTLKIADLVQDLQLRVGLDMDTVNEYRDRMQEGTKFPAITVVAIKTKNGPVYRLCDGYHRIAAAQALGWTDIEATVQEGSENDAFVIAAQANMKNGLRMTNADKRNVVSKAIELFGIPNPNAKTKGKGISQRELAKRCGVTQAFISKFLKELNSDIEAKPQIHSPSKRVAKQPRSSKGTATVPKAASASPQPQASSLARLFEEFERLVYEAAANGREVSSMVIQLKKVAQEGSSSEVAASIDELILSNRDHLIHAFDDLW